VGVSGKEVFAAFALLASAAISMTSLGLHLFGSFIESVASHPDGVLFWTRFAAPARVTDDGGGSPRPG
jgi:hypothetical protein